MMKFIHIKKKTDAQKTVQNQFVKFIMTVISYCDADSITGNSGNEVLHALR